MTSSITVDAHLLNLAKEHLDLMKRAPKVPSDFPAIPPSLKPVPVALLHCADKPDFWLFDLTLKNTVVIQGEGNQRCPVIFDKNQQRVGIVQGINGLSFSLFHLDGRCLGYAFAANPDRSLFNLYDTAKHFCGVAVASWHN